VITRKITLFLHYVSVLNTLIFKSTIISYLLKTGTGKTHLSQNIKGFLILLNTREERFLKLKETEII
jgi:hypothetical protein